jgi:hypothetical protein
VKRWSLGLRFAMRAAMSEKPLKWELDKPDSYSTKEWEMFQSLTPEIVEAKLAAEGWTAAENSPNWLKGKDAVLLTKASSQDLLVVREYHPDWPARMLELVEHFCKLQDMPKLEALAWFLGKKVLIIEGEESDRQA